MDGAVARGRWGGGEGADEFSARTRLWGLVRNAGVSRFLNLNMVAPPCRLLASLSQVLPGPVPSSSSCSESSLAVVERRR